MHSPAYSVSQIAPLPPSPVSIARREPRSPLRVDVTRADDLPHEGASPKKRTPRNSKSGKSPKSPMKSPQSSPYAEQRFGEMLSSVDRRSSDASVRGGDRDAARGGGGVGGSSPDGDAGGRRMSAVERVAQSAEDDAQLAGGVTAGGDAASRRRDSNASTSDVLRDSDLPGAPGRFLSWLKQSPTLEGTLEKHKSETFFGPALRLFGVGVNRWKLRHYVLYDNHLFWGRGFSRMYGYGTVLSARASPEDGETAFALELVTHPKNSLRRRGMESVEVWERLYGFCWNTQGYEERIFRAGNTLDRDRWILAINKSIFSSGNSMRGGRSSSSSSSSLVEVKEVDGGGTPTEAMHATVERSVFSEEPTRSPTRSPNRGGERDDRDDAGGCCGGAGEESNDDSRATTPRRASTESASDDDEAAETAAAYEARERSGLWTPRDPSGAEAAAVAAWEEASAAALAANVAAEEEARRELRASRRRSGSGSGGGGSIAGSDAMDSTSSFATDASTEPSDAASTLRRGDSVPAEWLAAGAGGFGPDRRARGGGDDGDDAPAAPALRKQSSLGAGGAGAGGGGSVRGVKFESGANGEANVKRKVSFREESLEEMKLYAPTPTRKNPGGVGKTPSRLAPFSGKGGERGEGGMVSGREKGVDDALSSDETLLLPALDDDFGTERGGEKRLQALRLAAGRWVIPPHELKLGRRIGEGSFGEVFTADWNGTEVALKQTHDKVLSKDTAEELSGEIRMMQGMRHPNIVLFLGAVIESPRVSIVCELMPRGSLHSLLHGKARGGVELSHNGRLRLQMAQDCARGMSYLHSRAPAVVHHDLKPANLLVDAHWTLKVSDFGMSRLKYNSRLKSARRSGDASGDASDKAPGGTPEWMAPEGLRNEHSDERSDVYSFAVILWELMTLEYPWEELSSPVQIVVQVAFLHRRPRLPTWLPTEAVALLQRCWNKDPNKRPAFTEILEKLKADDMPEAWADLPSPRAREAEAAKDAAGAAGPGSGGDGEPPGPGGPPKTEAEVVVCADDFITIKGLPSIKTPKAKVKAPSALGPNRPSSSDESSDDGDGDGDGADADADADGAPKLPPIPPHGDGGGFSYDRAKHLATTPRATEEAPASPNSPALEAAAAVLPRLPSLKIVKPPNAIV